jgi:hypothetical protein
MLKIEKSSRPLRYFGGNIREGKSRIARGVCCYLDLTRN